MEPDRLRDELVDVLLALGGTPRADELAALLRAVCHDLNNTLGTLALELYSLGAITDEVAATIAPTSLQELRAALANAEMARETSEKLVEALHVCARVLDPPG
jgi:hypothetical protein